MPYVFKCNIYKIIPKLEIPAEIAKIVQFYILINVPQNMNLLIKHFLQLKIKYLKYYLNIKKIMD